MAITDWPETERPREKLLQRGARSLSDAELLAIFLRTGVAGKSAVDLARQLLKEFGNLTQLFAADEKTFCEVHGLGPAKYVQLQAVLEMARRTLTEELQQSNALSSPSTVKDYLRLALAGKKYEVFIALFLDTQNRVIAIEELFRGSLMETSVYPREVVKRALHHNAATLIFAHNHPTGKAKPSQADKGLTRILVDALALIDIKVLDHFIIAGNQIMAFSEEGLI